MHKNLDKLKIAYNQYQDLDDQKFTAEEYSNAIENTKKQYKHQIDDIKKQLDEQHRLLDIEKTRFARKEAELKDEADQANIKSETWEKMYTGQKNDNVRYLEDKSENLKFWKYVSDAVSVGGKVALGLLPILTYLLVKKK
jgi:hypothetical protein